MSNKKHTKVLLDIYNRLTAEYGTQHWWPSETPFEVIIGAILTQSAAWTNVEKAINNLKSAAALSAEKMQNMPLTELAALIRPSGYYNAKAKKLKAFVSFLDEHYNNDLDELFASDIRQLRELLLAVHGIGEETADSIILYAANKPVFVIDAYTRRIFSRLGLMPTEASYTEFQRYFMNNLPADARMFNEYHALLVNLGKMTCRKVPVCNTCCLKAICRHNLKSNK